MSKDWKEGGFFGVSQVASLVNFRSRVSGFSYKSCGFSGFEMLSPVVDLAIFCTRVLGISLKIPILSGSRSSFLL